MIHDAARPFLPVGLCCDLAAALERDPDIGVIPLLESADSLKLVDGDIRPLPREKIFRTQTPQAFRREDIKKVIESSGKTATDEATLWIESGRRLLHLPGSAHNFKITTNFDWAMARAIVEAGRETRVGMGYDVHELVPGRRLILGGVEIESPLGLLGHSDADIISHAAADALLGAAGMGDIGTMFPASDSRYKDAASVDLLATVAGAILREGWRIVNVDVTLKAQIPRMAGQLNIITENMRKLITSICPYAKINIKVKSGEGIGSVGRAECMECFAVAEIEKYEIERR
jgi:2-C-methyl-D-erythritol 4-phosphate cytidylyltransferase/2-C-methyl-D-erythritol 2,4-cyclodiphosphate synthase